MTQPTLQPDPMWSVDRWFSLPGGSDEILPLQDLIAVAQKAGQMAIKSEKAELWSEISITREQLKHCLDPDILIFYTLACIISCKACLELFFRSNSTRPVAKWIDMARHALPNACAFGVTDVRKKTGIWGVKGFVVWLKTWLMLQ